METPCPVCRGTGFEIRTRPDGLSQALPCACGVVDRAERRLRSAGIPRRYDHCTLDSFEIHDASHEEALRIARDWIERWPRVEHGVVFPGQPGTGKTHRAVALARELAARKGARVLFREQHELLKAIQATFDEGAARTEWEVLGPVRDAEVLILDDLGAGRPSAWASEVMHEIIVHRYNQERLLVATSNRVLEEEPEAEAGRDAEGLTLRDRLGDALMSRLYEMCLMVPFRGHDYRRGVRGAKIRA